MNIVLFGYGKMGKAIEKIANGRGHKIILKIDRETNVENLAGVDIAIDFSTPNSALKNIKFCLDSKIPIVSGTTGWLDSFDDIIEYVKLKDGSFIYASNFSIGVNLFFKLNEYLAELISKVNGYHVSVKEIHHIHKLDTPSGTAISLVEQIIGELDYDGWQLAEMNNPKKDHSGSKIIPVIAERKGEVPGLHNVMYKSEVDQIRIEHLASSRDGFALGAVIAAEWIIGKKGIFSMKDVLGI